MGKRDDMKKAIRKAQAAPKTAKVTVNLPTPVAAAANLAEPKPPKKENPRSSMARDARAKKRGRLPECTRIEASFAAGTWLGKVFVHDKNANCIMYFEHAADGLFRLMEELDVRFWQWFISLGEESDIKKSLVFAPHKSNKPEPMPKGHYDTQT